MKIVDNSLPQTIRFENVKIGDVFKSKDGLRYMKIPRTEIARVYTYDYIYDDIDIFVKNAINLTNGELKKFSFDDQVIPVDCELVIK